MPKRANRICRKKQWRHKEIRNTCPLRKKRPTKISCSGSQSIFRGFDNTIRVRMVPGSRKAFACIKRCDEPIRKELPCATGTPAL